MEIFEEEDYLEYKKISHHIESLSTDLHEIKKTILQKKKEEEILSKKDKKRRNSLKKAQKKFKNISTNLKQEDFERLEIRLKNLKMNKSEYLKNLVLQDIYS